MDHGCEECFRDEIEVVPVKSWVDELLHQVERSARDERCVQRVCETTSEPCGVSGAVDAVGERSVWSMQSTRSLIANAEWVRRVTLEPSIDLGFVCGLANQVPERCSR